MNVIQRSIRPLLVLALLYGQTANVCGATLCNPPCLLVANTSDIVAMDYQTAALSSVVSGLTRAVAIDIHFSLGYIFWSDVTEQNIKRFRIDVASTTTVITGIGVCDGLAVDWRASQLYWTDTTHDTISVSDLNGNNQVLLISSSLEEPRAIALDLDNSLMVWTDWGTNKKIERASLNGGQRVAMVTTELFYPNGIELDTGNKRIFWVDAGLDRVESVDYNGNNRKLLYQLSGLHPFGLTLIPPFLFFTDWVTAEDIHQLDATTGRVVRKFSVNGGRPMGIVAYDASRQPAASNPCTVNNGGCSHFCVTKSSGYECVCPTGLAVKQDGKTCEDKVKKFILFADADDKSTKYISLDTSYPASQTLFHHLGTQRPIALDYDPVEDRVYWSENAQGRIISAFFNATSVKTLFHCNVRTPDGLAIDYVGRNIYWTDTGTNRIEVGKLDGTRRKLLIKGGLDEPRAIILDEKNGMMYWTDWGSSPKIEKAEMDGSARRIIVMGSLVWPNGLTIDQATKRLFWADAKLDKIEVSDLNGGNRQLIMSSVADIHPYGLAVYHDMLYWTDWNAKSISNYNLSTGNKDTLVDGLQQPMDIHIFDPALIFSGSHNCSQDNGLCSDFCLLKPGGHQCACPTGIALKSDGKTCDHGVFDKASSDKFVIFAEADNGEIYKVPLEVPETPCYPLEISTNISRPVAVDYDPGEGKIYWSDVTLELVARAFPNGSSVDVIAYNNVITPGGLAIDYIGRNIYWTDEANNRIEVARMDGSSRRSLITSNIERPRAILLDIGERKMYWGGRGISLKIEQANMDGSARTTLVSSGLTWVNSLAMDYQRRLLYWCDAALDKIERVDLEGNNRVVILSLDLMHPFGLALFGDVLFWSDWNSQSIHKYNMTTSVEEVVVYGIGQPMELHVFDQSQLFTGTTSCSQLNGGCSHLCLPNPSGHQCFCPEGVQLKPGDPFTCEGAVTCSALLTPPHGIRQGCTGTTTEYYNTVCLFSCNAGFIATGSPSRKCLNNGTWSGQDFLCRAITCPSLSIPARAIMLTASCGNTYGSNCVFGCHSGYASVQGNVTRTCLQTGLWSGNPINCTAITCPQLSIPARAILLTVSCGNTYGSNCVFGCQNGYDIVDGNMTRTCLQTGQWSGNPINCTDVLAPTFNDTCPTSPLLMYAERGISSAQVNWTEPVATDNSGDAPSLTSNYEPPQRFSQGTHGITYTAVDQSGNTANCTFAIEVLVINCTSLTVNSGGALRMSNCGNHFGAQCNFTCAIGHRLNGSLTVTCVAPGNEPPGVWDNPLPSCQVIRCSPLLVPTNGVKTSCTNNTSEPYGTHCSFSCNVGYNLVGSSIRRCLENGTWSGETSYCQVITCGPLVLLNDGVLHVSPSSCLTSSLYGQTCTFTCRRPGYVLEGTSTRVCGNKGQWNGTNNTNCTDVQAPNITCPPNMDNIPTEPGQSYANAEWQLPDYADNSNETLTPIGLQPPLKIDVGKTYITYNVTDKSGLSGSCEFFIHVKDFELPTIANCPDNINKTSKENLTKVFFPGVTVTDNVGVHSFEPSKPNGSEFTWGEHNVTFTASDKAGNIAKCHFQVVIRATDKQERSKDTDKQERAEEKRTSFPLLATLAGLISPFVLIIVVRFGVKRNRSRGKRIAPNTPTIGRIEIQRNLSHGVDTHNGIAEMLTSCSPPIARSPGLQIENETEQDSPYSSHETLCSYLSTSSPKYITKLEAKFTNTGGELCASLDSDVRIIVPSGAVPVGMSQPLFFGVFSDETSLLQDIPEALDKTLISPVVECGPHKIHFLKPVEIIVPHCLCLTEANKESITVYRCGTFSAEVEGRLSWERVARESEKSSQSKCCFTVTNDSIRIKTKTFSLWSIFACGGPRRKRATVFSSRPDPKSDLIYLRFYVYSDNEDSKRCVELKDRERFPESKPAKEKPFRMHSNNTVITVKLTNLENGWVLDKTNDIQLYNYERANGNAFRSKDSCDFAVKPEDGRDVNGFSCIVKFQQEDADDEHEYSIYVNPGFTPLRRQSIRQSTAEGGRRDSSSRSACLVVGSSTSRGLEEDEDCGSHSTEGGLSPDSSRGEGSADCGHVDEMVTEELCHYISPYIGGNWRDVLRNLSMNEVTIRNLEEDHKSYGVVEKCYLGLLRWKESVGPQLATIKKLCRALHITVGCSKALEVLRHKTVQGCST